jgi:hypothetical protein
MPDNRPTAKAAYRHPTRDEVARILFDAKPRPKPLTVDSNLDLDRRIFLSFQSLGGMLARPTSE